MNANSQQELVLQSMYLLFVESEDVLRSTFLALPLLKMYS